MRIKPNLYDGPYRITAKADKDENSNGRYFDIKGKIKEGINYTFSAKVKIENLEGVEETKSVAMGLQDGMNKKFLSYTGPYKDTAGRGMTWYEVELVEGDIGNKVFIPSKSSLEPSKQPLLPPEGYYKEIKSI